MILSIDPGNIDSAWVLYDNDKKKPFQFAKENNEEILKKMLKFRENCNALAIEMIASYGMPVGSSVFDTCVWIGRFVQKWKDSNGIVDYIYRKDVKMHLCHTMKAKDSNIRQSILDRYGSSREIAIGNKKKPGICYGISKDIWSALGVAITHSETKKI